MNITITFLIVIVLTAIGSTVARAAEGAGQNLRFENEKLRLHVSPRTPQQIAGFYIARGFPDNAVEVLKAACFVTVGVRNRSRQILWLEPSRWRFTTRDGQPVTRLDRDYWRSRWEQMDVPQAQRSTFRYTLLPERRDLHPDEPAGGNLVFRPPSAPFTIEARFATGSQEQTGAVTVHIDNVECTRSTP